MFSANNKEEDSDAKVDLHNDAPAGTACAVAGGLWRWHNRRADHRCCANRCGSGAHRRAGPNGCG